MQKMQTRTLCTQTLTWIFFCWTWVTDEALIDCPVSCIFFKVNFAFNAFNGSFTLERAVLQLFSFYDTESQFIQVLILFFFFRTFIYSCIGKVLSSPFKCPITQGVTQCC